MTHSRDAKITAITNLQKLGKHRNNTLKNVRIRRIKADKERIKNDKESRGN